MRIRLVISCLLCGWLTLAQAATGPEPFVARYKVSLDSVPVGESTRSLEKQPNDEFVYRTRMTPNGLAALLLKDTVEESSRFRINRGELQALEYAYQRTGGKKTRTIQARLDWQKSVATGTQDGRPWRVPIRPGVTDRLLYQLAASSDLQRGRKTLNYLVADEGELKPYTLDMLGPETLETALGRLETIKIRRLDGPYATTLWMAKELAYLPVRIEHQEKGKRIRADITSLRGLSRKRSQPVTGNP